MQHVNQYVLALTLLVPLSTPGRAETPQPGQTLQRDLGGWVNDAKALVERELRLPPGYRLQWTGQYEFMETMQARMAWVVPLTLLLVVFLLRRAMRGWSQTGLVLTSLPFAFGTRPPST